MALGLTNSTANAAVNNPAINSILKSLESLIVARFEKMTTAQGNMNNSILTLNAEVRELREACNKVAANMANLEAAIRLNSIAAQKPAPAIASAQKPAASAPAIASADDSKLIAAINGCSDARELKAIREKDSRLAGVIIRGNPNNYGPDGVAKIKSIMMSALGIEKPAAPAANDHPNAPAPVITLDDWSKSLQVNRESLVKIIAAVRATESKLLCKDDFDEIKTFLGKDALPDAFMSWLQSVRDSVARA